MTNSVSVANASVRRLGISAGCPGSAAGARRLS